MKTENNKLDELRDRNPFRVPEGYFESFTEDLMKRLPEKDGAVVQSEEPLIEPKKVSLYDRVKPLLYMAAAFVGVMLFFNIFYKTNDDATNGKGGVFVKNVSSTSSDILSEADENAEFLEYIEDMYADKYAISYIDDFLYN